MLRFFILFFHCIHLNAAIYDKDDRKEIHEVMELKSVAQAVAVMVGKDLFFDQGDYIELDDFFLSYASNFLCPGEKFIEKPSIGLCTGFLVGPQTLVTAGHCIAQGGITENSKENCEGLQWIFNFNSVGGEDPFYIAKEKVFECEEVTYAEKLDPSWDDKGVEVEGNDFAIVKLKRPVEGIEPLKWASAPFEEGDLSYTIGHPLGLPAIFSGYSPVIERWDSRLGIVNLDTLSGNSGGPVLNAMNEVIGVLISGHGSDLVGPSNEGCYTVNVCDSDSKNCVENSELQFSNHFMLSEVIQQHLTVE